MEGNFEEYLRPNRSWEDQLNKAKEFVYKKLGPGINISVFKDGEWVRRSYGYKDEPEVQTNPEILYDIASITKLVTALQILELEQQGTLNLEDRAGEYLDFLKSSPLQIKDLLAHRGAQVLTREKYVPGTPYLRSDLERIFENPDNLTLDRPTDYNYGDLGYLHLGLLLETVEGENLAAKTRRFVEKYELGTLLYNPVAAGVEMTDIARSETNNLPGEVQDEKAKWYGGVSGHAGLFATQHALETLVERLFNRQFDLRPARYAKLYTPEFEPSPVTGMSFSLAGIRRGLYSEYPNISGFGGSTIFFDPGETQALVHTCNITYPHRPASREEFRKWNRKIGRRA